MLSTQRMLEAHETQTAEGERETERQRDRETERQSETDRETQKTFGFVNRGVHVHWPHAMQEA